MLTEEQVHAADAERIGAMIDGGLERLDDLFSDDLLWVHASGVVDTKQSLLEQFSAGTMRCFSIAASDSRVRIFGEVAVMTGVIEMDAQARGARRTVRSRFTGVWRGGASATELVSWHSTRLPETPSGAGPGSGAPGAPGTPGTAGQRAEG